MAIRLPNDPGSSGSPATGDVSRASAGRAAPASSGLRLFARNQRGGVLLLFGLMAPVLFGTVGAAVEYASLTARRAKLQSAVDAGALAAAKELTLSSVTQVRIESVAQQVAVTTLNGSSSRGGGEAMISAAVLNNGKAVKVAAREPIAGVMGRLVMLPMTELAVDATAGVSGRMNICLLGLDAAQQGTVHMEESSRLTAPGCAVFSSSKSPKGLMGQEQASLQAAFICTAGGYEGNGANFSPTPVTDCPVPSDPLAARPRPSYFGCTSVNKVVKTSQSLSPGTYCGGLTITDGAYVTLSPGIYVMEDGPLILNKKATLIGQNTGFFFTGYRGGLSFDVDTTVSLTAPRDGPMSGLLFFEDRVLGLPSGSINISLLGLVTLSIDLSALTNSKGPVPLLGPGSPPMRVYRVSSNDARNLLGTIYLPAGRLIIDADKPVSDRSAYTVIVARRVDLYDGPNLILNTDYGGTDIPVPEGVGAVGGTVLIR